jgi:hypothetical protein
MSLLRGAQPAVLAAVERGGVSCIAVEEASTNWHFAG